MPRLAVAVPGARGPIGRTSVAHAPIPDLPIPRTDPTGHFLSILRNQPGVSRLLQQPLHEQFRLPPHEGAVHEVEALAGHVGGVAALRGQARVREVEGLQELVDLEAAHLAVDGAAVVLLVAQALRRPAHGGVQVPGHLQDRVADALGIEPAPVRAPVVAVGSVDGLVAGVLPAGQLIRRRQHDVAVQLLDRHPALDEARRQVLEQLGVRGPLAHHPEVAGGVDDARAHVPAPDSVHNDARGDRVPGDGLRELQPAASPGVRLGALLVEDGQKAARHRLAQVRGAAADVQGDVRQILGLLVGHAHREGQVRKLLLQLLDAFAHGRDMVHRHAPELPLQPPSAEPEQPRGREEGVQLVVEVAAEDVRVEVEALPLHGLELELVLVEEALEAVGHRRRLHFLERRALGDDALVAILQLLLLRGHLEHQALEGVGQLLGLVLLGVAARDHLLPVDQERIVLRLLAQEADPALQRFEVDLGLRGGLLGRKLRPAGHLPRGHHVARHLEREHARQLVALGAQVLVETLLQAVDELLFLLVGLGFVLFRNRIFVIVGVVEDAGEGIVVVRADGVVLVVVAAGAAHGEAQEPARRDVDAVVALVGARHRRIGDVVVPGTAPEKAQRGDGALAFGLLQQVARDLRLDEEVVGHVAVEGLDHPVALDVGVGVALASRTARRQPAGVVLAEAGHVQPVPAPALAVVGGGQQPLDDLPEGVRRRVADEGVDLLGGRGQAGQVEGGAPDELAAVGGPQRLKPLLLDLREHEAVDVVLGPVGVRGRGDVGIGQGPERPEVTLGGGYSAPGDRERRGDLGPLRPSLDPLDEPLDFGVGELIRVARHLQVIVHMPERGDDEALFRVPRDDRGAAAASLEHPLAGIEPETAPFVVGVAREAAALEDRPHLVDEEPSAGRESLVGEGEDGPRGSSRACRACPPCRAFSHHRPGRVHANPLDQPLDLLRR